MKRFTKKILSAVLALTLVIGLATSASAANWDSYLNGRETGFKEAAIGTMTKNTATAWTASLELVGWGGVWGGQVYQPINVVKGTAYNISFTAKSTNVNKFIYVKMATKDEKLAKGFWVKLPKGKNVKVSETFVAANTAPQITFGIGGDDGTRVGSDKDAETRYGIFDKQFGAGKHKQLVSMDCNGDFSSVTQIMVTNYKLVKAAKSVSFKAKAKGKKKVKVTMKKATGIAKYEVKVGKVKKTTSSTSITVKAKKKGKQKVQVRGLSKDKSYKTKWTKKTVKVK
ncbi:MAG: carbohydrate binding domain-containing protein [Eubacterium sp.]|nr:carbohydrate binding domain-containing protein [Eubacterium sp.]